MNLDVYIGTFNQGLMELGATVCKPQNPDCAKCPLSNICVAKELVARRNDFITESEIDFTTSSIDDSIQDIEDLIYKQVNLFDL